jgi:DNA-binding NtrC family response regulator
VERAAILADGQEMDGASLQLPAPRPAPGQIPAGMLDKSFQWEGTLDDVTTRALEHLERFKLAEALRECKWNKSRAAERLGVSYKTLLHKIKLLGLES